MNAALPKRVRREPQSDRLSKQILRTRWIVIVILDLPSKNGIAKHIGTHVNPGLQKVSKKLEHWGFRLWVAEGEDGPSLQLSNKSFGEN